MRKRLRKTWMQDKPVKRVLSKEVSGRKGGSGAQIELGVEKRMTFGMWQSVNGPSHAHIGLFGFTS